MAELVPAGCRVTILADRGFGDQKLFSFLAELGFDDVIRFLGNIHVADADGTTKPAAEWVGKGGRARKLTDACVTAKGQQVGAVVCVHAKDMKEPWCLAASDRDATAATLINHYSKRWTIEPQFRDTKDLRFGMGLSSTRIGEPTRRDRLLLVSAVTTALLTPPQQDADALAVPPRLLALRTDPEHAGRSRRAVAQEIRRSCCNDGSFSTANAVSK